MDARCALSTHLPQLGQGLSIGAVDEHIVEPGAHGPVADKETCSFTHEIHLISPQMHITELLTLEVPMVLQVATSKLNLWSGGRSSLSFVRSFTNRIYRSYIVHMFEGKYSDDIA